MIDKQFFEEEIDSTETIAPIRNRHNYSFMLCNKVTDAEDIEEDTRKKDEDEVLQ